MDVLDVDDSIYNTCECHIFIDLGFYTHLQDYHKDNITQFFALPKIIPAKKKKRQQPSLNFTKSKILTFAAYTQGCEELLEERMAYQTEAKRKAAEKVAMKEIRQKEKEDR